jgi:RNA polymerase sigma-70 factor (ECF subfamily)
MEIAMSQPCPQQLRSIPAGDAEAKVSQLYRENGAFVLSYVTRLLRDRFLAEDVVQETMLRAWRHCDELSPDKGSVRGWLVRVAHNIAMDKIRMRRSRPAEVAEETAPDAVFEDHADAVVSALHIRQVLSRLSPGQREVLEQMYLHGCTARETAQRLGIPEGTVFSRSFHAMRTLRRELGAAVPEPAESARRAA